MAHPLLRQYNGRQPNPDDDHPRVVPMHVVTKILQLHARGKSAGQIAVAVSRAPSRVREIIDREFRRVEKPLRDEAIKKTLLRVESLITTLYDEVDGAAGELKLKAIDRALRAEERYAKLLGLDAPTKIDATVREVDATDDELAQIIREETARTQKAG